MNCIYGIDDYKYRKETYHKLDGDVLENTDVCVIGSGAAGAVLAKKFCDAGKSVILLEKGGYYDDEDMNQIDEDMIPLLWKNSGANFTDDLRIAIAQGSCLGGSTNINDAVCFPIPDIVRKQWREMGVDVSDQEWENATAEVSREIHVTEVTEAELDRNSLMLRKGCQMMGYTEHRPNSRNCTNCMQCGLCHLGCHYETKQEPRITYIHNALNNPDSQLRIYCNCSAETITSSDGVVDGVEGSFQDADDNEVCKIRVNAKLVIVAAGAIASTALLMKNGIAKNKAGKGLALHPAPFVLGDFPFEVRANQGIPMAYTLHQFGVTNGVEQGGFLVEGIYLPPFQFSMALPIGGGQHEELMKRYQHYSMAGILVRDGSNGTITIANDGVPRVSYSLSPMEIDMIAKGVEVVAKMWFGLGATKVITSHLALPIIEGTGQIPNLVEAIRNDSKSLLMGSAHPQGGNRMGNDSKICVVDSNCKVYDYRNLFVCDASVFPTAVGVNPQLTVMSLATLVADRINKGWSNFAAPEITEKLGQICSLEQPMYCRTNQLNQKYEISDTILPSSALLNSAKMEIVDGENWSFDPKTLMIWNNRYWKGFFTADPASLTSVLLYAGGFWKRFVQSNDIIDGVTHPYYAPVFAKNQPIDTEYPGFGKVIRLKYLEPEFEKFYDLLKIIDKDTILGQAFAGEDPPRGVQILTFSMSRRYSVDFMTQDDFKAIFSSKSRKPNAEEVLGKWEGRFISDSAVSPVMFRFTYLMDQGSLKCNYNFGGVLPGTSNTKFTKDMMDMFDFTGNLFHDEIRMVGPNFMVGRYSSKESPVLKLLKGIPGFIMVEGDVLSLPYMLRRIF